MYIYIYIYQVTRLAAVETDKELDFGPTSAGNKRQGGRRLSMHVVSKILLSTKHSRINCESHLLHLLFM